MRFHIDHDDGQSIRCWIVPDNPLAISRMVVVGEGRRIAEIPASLVDEAFRQSGWHSTGQCTFQLTEAEVPGLSQLLEQDAIAAEQARLLHERHAVPEDEASRLTDRMRSHGVRWLNMRKNVTAGVYAFNWLQQWLLPEGYRAPKGTYREFGGAPT